MLNKTTQLIISSAYCCVLGHHDGSHAAGMCHVQSQQNKQKQAGWPPTRREWWIAGGLRWLSHCQNPTWISAQEKQAQQRDMYALEEATGVLISMVLLLCSDCTAATQQCLLLCYNGAMLPFKGG